VKLYSGGLRNRKPAPTDVRVVDTLRKKRVVRYHGKENALNSTRAFENEHDRLFEKLRQLREAAKPFVALQHYFEHGTPAGMTH
jgi:hypothetical protein